MISKRNTLLLLLLILLGLAVLFYVYNNKNLETFNVNDYLNSAVASKIEPNKEYYIRIKPYGRHHAKYNQKSIKFISSSTPEKRISMTSDFSSAIKFKAKGFFPGKPEANLWYLKYGSYYLSRDGGDVELRNSKHALKPYTWWKISEINSSLQNLEDEPKYPYFRDDVLKISSFKNVFNKDKFNTHIELIDSSKISFKPVYDPNSPNPLYKQNRDFTIHDERKTREELVNGLSINDKCVDKHNRCGSGNFYTNPDGKGIISSNGLSDCDNPQNQDAEAKMWLNCCRTCDNKVRGTPRSRVCKNFLGLDKNGNDLCRKATSKFGCIPMLNILCCKTCSEFGKSKFIIDKNIKLNDDVVIHRNNFNKNTDMKDQVKDVLSYVSPGSEETFRKDLHADIYIKERNYNGTSMSYDYQNKKPKIYLDNLKLDGDILSDLFKSRAPYFVAHNPNPRNKKFDGDTIHKYAIYDDNSDLKYSKLCFYDRNTPDNKDVCIDSDSLKILTGEKDVKIKNVNSKCLGYRGKFVRGWSYKGEKPEVWKSTYKELGKNIHHKYPPSPKDVSHTLFYDSCDNRLNTNRFSIDNISARIDTKLNIKE